ncbi:MAG: hypothetical protein JXQ96_10370 [Cyclobacteriaceae bacterium]
MDQGYKLLLILLLCVSCVARAQDEFDKLNELPDWELKFSDPCTSNWQNNWFLDGDIAKVEHNEYGMELIAGPINRNDAHHSVLWTKQSFEGDLKIEYNYTRTDSQIVNVNILFIQATGTGKEGFDKDISKWNDYRKVPTMSKYWLNMNTIHVSVAAFPMVNEDPENDYIRVRRYPAASKDREDFNKMEVPPTSFKTGLFKTGVTYKMTWIKSNSKLYLEMNGDDQLKRYSWDLSKFDPITEGRIGLRHMFTRSAAYKDFKVYDK